MLALCAAAACPSAAEARTLHNGDRGDDVRELQRLLTALGHRVEADGAFGARTESAVRAYEAGIGAPVDGQGTDAELAEMRRRADATRPTTAPAAESPIARTLRRGMRGADVREVQRLLSRVGIRTKRDGVFGPGTEKNVRRYERRERLAVDGVVSRGQAKGLVRRAGGAATPAPRSETTPVSAGGRAFPINGRWRWGEEGAHFGDRDGRHRGEDVFAECGTPLVAVESARVRHVGHQSAAGHYLVIVGAESGESYAYMHLRSAPAVTEGAQVQVGQQVGEVGRSGNASACHLHFELWTAPGWYAGGQPIDPRPRLREWSGATPATAASN